MSWEIDGHWLDFEEPRGPAMPEPPIGIRELIRTTDKWTCLDCGQPVCFGGFARPYRFDQPVYFNGNNWNLHGCVDSPRVAWWCALPQQQLEKDE